MRQILAIAHRLSTPDVCENANHDGDGAKSGAKSSGRDGDEYTIRELIYAMDGVDFRQMYYYTPIVDIYGILRAKIRHEIGALVVSNPFLGKDGVKIVSDMVTNIYFPAKGTAKKTALSRLDKLTKMRQEAKAKKRAQGKG